MITYGQRPNPSQQSWTSLGAVATGDVFMPVYYRTAPDGAALTALQRTGQVPSGSHAMLPRYTAAGPPGLFDSVPAATHAMMLPPLRTGGPGTPTDPAMRV